MHGSSVRSTSLAGVAVIMLVSPMGGVGTAAESSQPPGTAAEATAIAVRLATATAAGGQAHLAAEADRISLVDPSMLVPCLAAFGQATPGGVNWLSSGLDRAVERLDDRFPFDEIVAFVSDTARPSRGRTLAYEWLRSRDAARADALLDAMLDDPALPLRRAAVEKRLSAAGTLEADAELGVHREMLSSARDVDQVERIATWLREHGDEVDVCSVLGFVRRWRVSETYDNSGGAGFARAYPPEVAAAALDTANWKEVTAAGDHGEVDLNAALGAKKGVLTYAVAELDMPRGRRAEVRVGSPCGVAVWVNGRPVMSHEIYHASEAIDQYVAEAEFRAGTNVVLVKCCQNEQTESWAADWKFQLRVCDELGSPLGTQP